MTLDTTARSPDPKLDYAAPVRVSPIAGIAAPALRATAALLLVLVIGVICNADHAFFRFSTHQQTFREVSVPGILACGMTIVIVCGGIDLSVGSVLALTAVTFALTSMHKGWNPFVSISVCLAVGAACGAVNGILSATFKIQPFISTLAMMAFARGLAKADFFSGGEKVGRSIQNADGTFRNVPVPAIFEAIDTRILHGNVAVVSIIFLACVLVSYILLARHRWGRQLYAIGGNEEAARLSGVPVQRAMIFAYAFCGLLAAIAGICEAAQEQQGDPEAGMGYELTAIAMVVVGGTALTGGRGGVLLTLLGVLTIGYVDKILSINAVSESWRLMLTGVIIIVAVLAQGRRRT